MESIIMRSSIEQIFTKNYISPTWFVNIQMRGAWPTTCFSATCHNKISSNWDVDGRNWALVSEKQQCCHWSPRWILNSCSFVQFLPSKFWMLRRRTVIVLLNYFLAAQSYGRGCRLKKFLDTFGDKLIWISWNMRRNSTFWQFQMISFQC